MENVIFFLTMENQPLAQELEHTDVAVRGPALSAGILSSVLQELNLIKYNNTV